MLAPLHWHDYKIKFGKLDDFVASHPEVVSCKTLHFCTCEIILSEVLKL